MQVTLTGSLGNISSLLARSLTADGHEVKLITSSAQKASAIEHLGATALIGSVDDFDFMKKAVAGSDAVYLMIPPNPQAADAKQYIKKTGAQYARALKDTGIRYVVNLSSIGAHLENGPGPTGANYFVEAKLNELQDTQVLHLRPGMFFTNFYGAIPLIREQRRLGNNFGGEVQLPLTHPRDIAAAAFNGLRSPTFSGKQVKYVVSDVQNGFEVAKVLGDAIGAPAIDWTAFSDEELLAALVKSGLPRQMAMVYIVEIGVALRSGVFMEDFNLNQSLSEAGTTLKDFAGEFARVYHSSSS